MKTQYIHPTDESAKTLFSQPLENEILMLNLLRFNVIADYSKFPDIAPEQPLSGKQAYQIYMEQTLPLLKQAGGEIVLMGDASSFFIGPADETWDCVMIVRQKSIASFLSFASNDQIKSITRHREAALADSRILPFRQN